MLLPLPDAYALVLNASVRSEWAVTEYEGAGLAAARSLRYAGILAVRGDVRIQVEWQCPAAGGPWERRHAEAAVRADGHDPADWVKPHPLRWYCPDSRDADRRCLVSGVNAAVRLLGYPGDALRAAVLDQCSGRRALATRR